MLDRYIRVRVRHPAPSKMTHLPLNPCLANATGFDGDGSAADGVVRLCDDAALWAQQPDRPAPLAGIWSSMTSAAAGVTPSTVLSTTTADCAVFDFALYTVVGGSLCVFGVLGNILSFIVLQLQRGDGAASSATTLLLRALAVADSLVLVVAVPLYALTPVSAYIDAAAAVPLGEKIHSTGNQSATTSAFGNLFRSYYKVYPSIMPYLWPLYLMPYTATVWLTVLVSADRYAAVCRPFRSAASKLRSGSRTCRKVVYVAIFAVVYNIPRFFEYQSGGDSIDNGDSTTPANGSNLTRSPTDVIQEVTEQPSIGLSEFGQNKVYRILYANVLYFVVMHGGPILLLAFLNSRLITALKAQDRKRKLMSNGRQTAAASNSAGNGGGTSQLHQQQQQQQDLTLTLVVVVFVFIICQTPTFVDHVLWTVVTKDQTQCGHWHYYYTAVGDVLAILNSSVNFVVYVVASPKFRRGLVALLCRHPFCRAVGGGSGGGSDVIQCVEGGPRRLPDAGQSTCASVAAAVLLRCCQPDFENIRRKSAKLCRCCNSCRNSDQMMNAGGDMIRRRSDEAEDIRTLVSETPNVAVIALHSTDSGVEQTDLTCPAPCHNSAGSVLVPAQLSDRV
jgi:hypothetical protein